MDTTIGSRVRTILQEQGLTQKELAHKVGMPADALSRALNGVRGFGSLEIVQLADELGVEVYWLITGKEDPNRLQVAARHAYDHGTSTYSNRSASDDTGVLRDIQVAYQQACPSEPLPASRLPADAVELRQALAGPDGVRRFADVVEARFEVDVVRIREVGTDYAMSIGGRAVVVLRETANWFYENWSLAHELGHLVDGDDCATTSANAAAERAANRFAAEVLLPADEMKRLQDVTEATQLGSLLWDWGVSTAAVRIRAEALGLELRPTVRGWLETPTVQFLRATAMPDRWAEIAERRREATARRFPAFICDAHERGIAEGRLGASTLAWMLGVDEDAVEVSRPDTQRLSVQELAAAFGTSLA
jgi:transcriptional regulator with XRE-family HTH domain